MEPDHTTLARAVSANGKTALLSLIFTGPLVFDLTSRVAGLPLPRIDDGAFAANQSLNKRRWQ